MKIIYKITNLINQKVYIGQTKNFERRKREHYAHGYDNVNKVLYSAMKKYGNENFIMEIIEEVNEDEANQKEQYWINYYDSTNEEKGYNVDLADTSSEENHKLTQQEAISIIEDLKNTELTYQELAEKYNCSHAKISNINTGDRVRFEDETYPIRPLTRKRRKKLTEEDIDNIYFDLLNTDLSYTQLSEKYNCGNKVFQHINVGQYHVKEGYDYPLRKRN